MGVSAAAASVSVTGALNVKTLVASAAHSPPLLTLRAYRSPRWPEGATRLAGLAGGRGSDCGSAQVRKKQATV